MWWKAPLTHHTGWTLSFHRPVPFPLGFTSATFTCWGDLQKFSTFNKGPTFSFTGKEVNEVSRFGPAVVCVVAESRNTSNYYFLFHNDWNHKKTEKYANRTTTLNPKKQQQTLEKLLRRYCHRHLGSKVREECPSHRIKQLPEEWAMSYLFYIALLGGHLGISQYLLRKKQNRKKIELSCN